MSCTSMSIPSSPVAAREHNVFLRSDSGKDFFDQVGLRRSQSDSQFRCSVNCIQAASTNPKLKNSRSTTGILPFRSFLDLGKEMSTVEHLEERENGEVAEEVVVETGSETDKRANWVERLLELQSHWRNRQQKEQIDDDDGDEGNCNVDYSSDVDEEDEELKFDQELFSSLLVEVPWSDIKLFSQLAFLCNMAYVIPEIKAEDLNKYYDLRFVTSSLEKKAEAASKKAKLEHDSTRVSIPSSTTESKSRSDSEKTMDSEQKRPMRASAAYEIAASAASFVHSRAKDLLSIGSAPHHENTEMEPSGSEENNLTERRGYPPSRVYKSEVAAHVAASTMTTLVAAEETAKQEAARDLQSLQCSPCEWFVCDDASTYTRCFVIQGSDSLASWQANLFFEPTKFEGTEVLVHRGIYEAAKGVYEQFMPEILSHLKKYGDRAKLRFTGHSLGGSLSLLVNLMLLTRGIIKPSTLLPVVTFGSPFVFCGGCRMLDELGLDESHIHSVMMHRDIVPRAFSCNYPDHVAQVLKRLNGALRTHPCLNKNKLLYSPMGKLFVLQPDEKSSPPHPLLPSGSAFYALDKTKCGSQMVIASALRTFINYPHPLETLSDPTAYGSEGTILRDHDSSNYLKAVNGILRQHTKLVARRSRREKLYNLWPLWTTPFHQTWNHEGNLENTRLATKEVVTGV